MILSVWPCDDLTVDDAHEDVPYGYMYYTLTPY